MRSPPRRRAFVLTLDGFVSLALLASMLSIIIAAQANFSEPGARTLQPLAYDFLVGAYRYDTSLVTAGQVNAITNLTLSETEPTGATRSVVSARLRQPNNLCGCAQGSWGSPCIITRVNACLTTNETIATLVTRTAYITPP